jgi:triacylglycerol esterase/lipase EstA (alpha/beta hydrolase family)
VSCFKPHHLRAVELRDFIYARLYVRVRQTAAARGVSPMDVSLADFKYNLVCHSQGGINARYLVKVLAMPDPRYDSAATAPLLPASRFVSSIVMLGAPNQGTYIAQWIVEAPKPLSSLAAWVFENLWAGLIAGQNDNEFMEATRNCTEAYMTGTFNPILARIGRRTDHIKVFTYSASVKGCSLNLNALLILPLCTIINSDPKYAGNNPNDGVVPRRSAEWAPTGGEIYGDWQFVEHLQGWLPLIGTIGVDHWMLINQLLGFHPGFDAKQFYRDISDKLASEGL